MEGVNQKELEDARADIDAVQRIFSLLFKVCQDLSPNLQIIVIEHANLENEQFQKALVESPWTGGRALVPESWTK
jgi:hypothetical protein